MKGKLGDKKSDDKNRKTTSLEAWTHCRSEARKQYGPKDLHRGQGPGNPNSQEANARKEVVCLDS
jgi:hypothetical protein